jgi:hypothetical protein
VFFASIVYDTQPNPDFQVRLVPAATIAHWHDLIPYFELCRFKGSWVFFSGLT